MFTGGLLGRVASVFFETPGGASAPGGEAASDGGGEAAAPAAAPAAPAFDPQVLNQRFDELAHGLETLAQRVPEPQAPAPPDPFDGVDVSGLIGSNDGIDPDEARAALGEMIQRAQGDTTDQLMQQVVAPLMQRIDAMETRGVALDVEQRNPELATKDGATAALQASAEFVGQLGLPQDVAAKLAGHPLMAEVMYRASRAQQQAAQEVPADGQPGVQLEGGGGAGQPGTNAEDNPATRIVNARQQSGGWW